MNFKKTALVTGGLLLLGASPGSGQEQSPQDGVVTEEAVLVTEVGILPEFKRGTLLPKEEWNPYEDRIVEKVVIADKESEAAKIIQVLETLNVRGMVRDVEGNVKTVLLGDIALRQGGSVPQLLPSQIDELYVSRVTNEEVEITWKTEAGKRVPDGRRLAFEINDDSRVEVILPGQPDIAEEAKKRALLVARPGEEAPGTGR